MRAYKIESSYNGKKYLLKVWINKEDEMPYLLNFDNERNMNKCIKDINSSSKYYITADRYNNYVYVAGNGIGWSGSSLLKYSNNKNDAIVFCCRAMAERRIKHERGNFKFHEL